MFTDTNGFVLRQTKATNGRRILVILSEKFGKISAGTSIGERSKAKGALALRPFTFARFEVQKNGEYYNITSAETIKSFYKIGEDLDKYFNCAFIFQLTEKILGEGQKNEKIYDLFLTFCHEIEQRNQKHQTLVIAYQIKALEILGYRPCLEQCVICGEPSKENAFSVKEGGIICDNCVRKNEQYKIPNSLIFHTKFDIVDIIIYLIRTPLSGLKKIGLEDQVAEKLGSIIKSYYEYHLGIEGLKSQDILGKEYTLK